MNLNLSIELGGPSFIKKLENFTKNRDRQTGVYVDFQIDSPSYS